MPVYQYRCQKCSELFELARRISERDKAPPRCPKCNGDEVQPVLTPFFAKTSRKS